MKPWVQCVSCYFVSAVLNWLFSASPSPLKRQHKATYQTIKQSCPSTDNNQCCYKNTSLTISLHFPVFVRRQKLRNTKRNSQGCCFAFERIIFLKNAQVYFRSMANVVICRVILSECAIRFQVCFRSFGKFIQLLWKPSLVYSQVVNAHAAEDAVIDYRKSDGKIKEKRFSQIGLCWLSTVTFFFFVFFFPLIAWAAGAIAYELFGEKNPFYDLNSSSYSEDQLPILGQ